MGSFYTRHLSEGVLFFIPDGGKQVFGVDDHCFGVLLIPEGHTTVEAGRDLWRSSSPMPLIQWDEMEPVAQDYVQLLQREEATRPQPVSLFQHSLSK